jgi:two-component system CheB/CheR fusion protein
LDLFEFAPIGYATLTLEGAIGAVNQAGTRILALRRPAVGLRFASFVAPEQRHRFDRLLADVRSSDLKQVAELRLTVPAGSARQTELTGEDAVQVRLTAAAIHRGEPAVLLAFEDITERKAHEFKLAQTEDRLRDAGRRKDEFLAVLAHELRNPLAPIRNSLFVLGHSRSSSEQIQKAHTIIDRQTTHLARLVDDLLDVTRIARGKIHLQRERVELGGLIRGTVEDQRAGFRASAVDLEIDVESGPIWVDGDPARLVQVLSNLLGNAQKFTPSGGHVLLKARREGDRVVVRVRDTGIGIAPEILPYLFQAFAQGPQTMERSRGGLGLGLAMVKGLVEMHEGSVDLTSDGPGRGTEVIIALPMAAQPIAKITSARATHERHQRVVIIEDSPDGADSLRDALELAGHEVKVAPDGPQGLALVRAFQPDVVVCDIGLPGMNGYEVARLIRAEQAMVRSYLIALSGYAQPEDLQRASGAGFDQHVAKPPSLDHLNRLIAEMPRSATT